MQHPAERRVLPASGAPAESARSPVPELFCHTCQQLVDPQGLGQCPKCHRFLVGSAMRRKTLPNAVRHAQLLRTLLDAYTPTTVQATSTCEVLARTLEELDRTKPGTPEHARLVTAQAQLFEVLNAAPRTLAPTATGYPGVSTMDDATLIQARTLLQQLASNAPLSDFERGAASMLTTVLRGRLRIDTLARPATPDSDDDDEPDDDAEEQTADDEEPEPDDDARPLSSPSSPTYCQFCTTDPCLGVADPRYDALHRNDPAEVERQACCTITP
jgi:hypothetical protein